MRRYNRDRVAGSRSAVVRQTILLTGALSVLPLLPYPNTLGLGTIGPGLLMGLVEGLLYLGVFSIAARWLTMPQLAAGAMATLVYRYILGVTCGTLMSISNNLPWGQSFGSTLWSYPPAVFLHILSAPWVMRSVLRELWGGEVHRSSTRTASPIQSIAPRSGDGPRRSDASPRILQGASASRISPHFVPGLEDAVAYAGEYDGVRMCWMVDTEGLPLAVWQRQEYTGSVEFWAPISLEIVEFDRRCLSVGGDVRPLRVEVRTDAGRIILETAGEYWLGVLTDRDTDELIGLRLSQSREMILKHLQERRAQYAGLQEARYV